MTRILIVEDDDQLKTMLTTLLKTSGYEVWEAVNGKRVCDMYQQQHFDLVITDLVMPDMDGLELIMALRRQDQDVRIMAISGGGQVGAEGYLKTARKLGAQVTLTKPFGSDEFLETVRLSLA